MKKLLSILLLISSFAYGQTTLKLKAIESATAGAGQTVITNSLGVLTYTPATSTNTANLVPYTGATNDVDLDTHGLNAKTLNVKGTAGNGHLGLKHQSSSITANASESSLGADASGNPVWKNDGNAIQQIATTDMSLTINGTTKTFTSTPSYTVNLQDVVNQDPTVNGLAIQSTSGFVFMNIDDTGIQLNTNGGVFEHDSEPILTDANTYTLTNKTYSDPVLSGSVTANSLTANRLVYSNGSKVLNSVNLGSGLSLTSGTLSATTQTTGLAPLSAPSLTNATLTGVTTQSTTNFNGAFNATYTTAASSTTVDLSTINANYISITGTTTINSFGTVQAGAQRTILFNGTLTVTSSTNIVLPGSTSIQTAANDIMVIVSNGSGVWRCVSYAKADESFISFPSSVTGFTTGLTVVSSYKMLTRNTYLFNLYTSVTTSTATTVTFTTPFNYPSGLNATPIPIWIYDNGTSSIGYFTQTAGSNVCNVFKANGGAFTASGNKSIRLSVVLISDIQ